ncbi:MAG: hypothetical protein LBP24_04345 [Coriobacteriales bacterium]|nr:hypothetical protein [Coriobacteriales bacterium]
MAKSSWKNEGRLSTGKGAQGQTPLVALLAIALLGVTALTVVVPFQGSEAPQQAGSGALIAEAQVTAEAPAPEATQQEAADAGQAATVVVAGTSTAPASTPAAPSPSPAPAEQQARVAGQATDEEETAPISELSEVEVLALDDETVVENAAAIVDSQEVGELIAQAQAELGRDFTDEEQELLAAGLRAQYAYDQAQAEGRATSQQFTAEEQAAIDEAIDEAAALDAEAADAVAQAEGGGFTTLGSTGSSSGIQPGGRYSPGVGTYPTTKGKILVTADWYKGFVPTGHAALVINQSSAYTSLPEGVTIEPNDWYDSNRHKTAFGLDVIKTNEKQEAAATDWCAQHVGKPYNYIFVLPKRTDAYYCSSLVWQAYQKTANVNLDTSAWSILGLNIVHPMEFVDSSQTALVYRQGTARTGWQTVDGVRYNIDANGKPR